jgi:hypothetical protein
MSCAANLWDRMVSWSDDTNRIEAFKEHNFEVAPASFILVMVTPKFTSDVEHKEAIESIFK